MRSIKVYRAKKGLTQLQLSIQLQVSRQYLALLEDPNFHKVPKTDVIKLSKILDCSPIELFGLDNFKINPTTIDDYKFLIDLLEKEMEKLNNGTNKKVETI